jgi:glyoxylase-like metal-dependent hydrolase (beta-lactamase superfamily II)
MRRTSLVRINTLGGKEVRAKYFGCGHTSGDAVVYFPDLGLIHSGDLFLGRPAPRAVGRRHRSIRWASFEPGARGSEG